MFSLPIQRFLRLLLAAATVLLCARDSARGQSPTTGNSATIAGAVVDAQSGLPIVSAQIRLPDAHRVEVSHEDGSFDFPNMAAGSYTLLVQRIGYRPFSRLVSVRSGETIDVRVALEPVALELAPQIVTGAISARAGEEVLSPTSIVSGRDLDRDLASTVGATLRDQPGVAVTSLGPATARPVIRGLGGDRILMLEDGQRPGDMSSTSGDHAVAIEPLTAQQLEVVRGPMSLLYGSSALGGVVNVVRDEVPSALPEHASGTLTLQGSSVNDGITGGGYVTSRLGRIALRAEGSARTNGDLRTPVGELTNTDARTYSAAAGAAYVRDVGYAGLAYRWYSNDYGIPGGFIGAHPRGVNIEMRRHTVRGDAELHVGGPFESIRASGLYTDYGHKELEAGGSLGTSFDQSLVGGDVIARHGELGPLALGAIGARLQYRDITTGGTLRTPSTYDWSAAGFLVEEVGRGRLRVQLGARYDWARYTPREEATISVGGERVPVRQRTFGSISGSLGVLYALRERTRVGASISRAYRTPDFNELYSDGPHLAANSFDVGDPTLEEETGLGADIFVRITRDRFRGEVAAFWNQLDNYIFPSSRGRAEIGGQGGVPLFQQTNEDARFVGAEGSLEWRVVGPIVAEGTVSYVRATFTSARAPIPIITFQDTTFVPASEFPPFIPPLNGRLDVRYDRPRWFVGVGTRWADGQDRLGDAEASTPGYVVASLTAGYRILAGSRAHAITLRADNLFDKEYRDHLARTKLIMPEPGRNVSMLYRLTF